MLKAEDRRELEELAANTCWQNFDIIAAAGFDEEVVGALRAETDKPVFFLDPRNIKPGRLDGLKDIYVCESVEAFRVKLRPHIRPSSRFLHIIPDWAIREFGSALDGFDKAIEKAYITSAQSDNTALHLSKTWIETILRALPGVAGTVPVNRLRGALAGIPGVVVAAGPSLDKNIDLLPELSKRAAICAVNTTLEPLEKRDVLADMLCIAEAKDIRTQLRDRTSLGSLALLAGVHAHHGVYDLPTRATMPCVSALGPFGRWVCEMLEADSLNCGGTVTTLALATLQRLGCDPIIMVGQDCAFDETKAYAACTDHADAHIEYTDDGLVMHLAEVSKAANDSIGLDIHAMPGDVVYAPAWGGKGQVKTSQMFDDFRTWFEEAAYFDRKQTGRALYNCTEGGASIKGFAEVPLAQVLSVLPPLKERAIETLMRAAAKEKPITSEAMIAHLRDQLRESEEAAELAEEGARIARRLGELKTAIGKKGHTAAVLDAWAAPKYMKIRNEPGYDDPMSKTTALYDAMYEVASREVPEALNDLIARLEEAHVRAA